MIFHENSPMFSPLKFFMPARTNCSLCFLSERSAKTELCAYFDDWSNDLFELVQNDASR